MDFYIEFSSFANIIHSDVIVVLDLAPSDPLHWLVVLLMCLHPFFEVFPYIYACVYYFRIITKH